MIKNTSLHFLKPKKQILKTSNLKIKKDDIIIKVESCGMCGTDLKIFLNGSKRVKKNRIMGHEISGKIVKVPKNEKYFKKNSNIVLGADIEDHTKEDFALGHEIDGGFQKFLVIKSNILKKFPHFFTKKKINYDQAAMTEPLACCINGIEKIDLKPKGTVVIFGAGTIGQLISKLCLLNKSKKVFLIDKSENRLKKIIKNKKLIKVNYKNINKILNQKVKENINYTFVACSSLKAQIDAVKLAPKNSSINFFAGLPKKNGKDPQIAISTNKIHYKELKIVGSHGSKMRHVIKAAKLIINKKINLNNMISHKFNLKNASLAFSKLKAGKGLKIIIKP